MTPTKIPCVLCLLDVDVTLVFRPIPVSSLSKSWDFVHESSRNVVNHNFNIVATVTEKAWGIDRRNTKEKKTQIWPFYCVDVVEWCLVLFVNFFFFMLKKLGCHRWLERYHQCYFTISDGREGTWLNGKIQKITKKIKNKNEKKSKPLI